MMRAQAPLASLLLPALAMAAVGLSGCHAIFGIHEVEEDPAAGEGGAGGRGGQGVQGDFAFAIRPPLVRVPYDGIALVDVEITPLAGFAAPVTVSVLGAPDGMVTEPLTIAAGEVQGQIQIGATGPLVIGTEFELRLIAVSGDLAREDSVPAVVADRPGTLDAGFGAGGITEWDLGQVGGALLDVREVPGGDILVTGNSVDGSGRMRFEVARLLASGDLDPSFNGSGLSDAKFCDCDQLQESRSVARLSDGRVIAVGQANGGSDQDIGVLRLRSDGTKENVDGDDGQVRVDLSNDSDEWAYDAVFDAGERLVVTGQHAGAALVARLAPPRYDALDTSFATTGYVTLPLTGGQALALDGMGRVVVAGWTGDAGAADIAVARLLASGALDATFGADGIATLSRSGGQRPVGLVLQPDGRILVAASTDEPGAGGFLALRLDQAGAPDPSFGTAGVAAPTLATGAGAAVGLALLLDGRVVLGGNAAGAPLLLRLTEGGAPDPTFGVGGEQPINLGPGAAMTALGLTAGGKLLLAGVRGQEPVRGLVARAFN